VRTYTDNHYSANLGFLFQIDPSAGKKVEGSVLIVWLIVVKKEARCDGHRPDKFQTTVHVVIYRGSNNIPKYDCIVPYAAHSRGDVTLLPALSLSTMTLESVGWAAVTTGRVSLHSIPWIPYYTGCFDHISKWMIVHDLWSQMMKHHWCSWRLRHNSNNSPRAVRGVLVCGAVRCNIAVIGFAVLRWTGTLAVWLQ
jgi:hypothetical protein